MDENKAQAEVKTKKKFKVPHTYVIIFCIILLMAVLTYIVPAGQYERVVDEATGRTVVDPDSFHYVDQQPIGFFQFFMNVDGGMQATASIIFFMFIVAGSFNIITSSGALDAGISRIAVHFRNSGKFLIPIIIAIFSIFGATIGMAEESIIFIPLGIALARAVGYDAIVGTAIVLLGCACGFTSGALNPFTVGVAQGLAEITIFSGIAMRIVIWIIMVIVTSAFVMRYAEKVRKDPAKSAVVELEEAEKHTVLDLDDLPELTVRHILTLLALVVGFGFIIYGVFKRGWYMDEIATTFLITGLAAGFLAGMGPSKICTEFVNGAKGIVFGALVVGLARAILLTMQNGLILDTLVHALAQVVGKLPSTFTAVGMYIVQSLINYLIPSGSGQAAATMPIMVPLADVTDVQRQVAVLAFQLGDGFSNSILPYSASCMGCLSVANIPWEKWAKWFVPLLGIWYVLGTIFMIVAQVIGYH